MSFFVKVTESVGLEIFGQWLRVKDLHLFDSAFCNHNERSAILGLLSNDNLFLSDLQVVLKWVSLRNVKLRKLFLSQKHFDTLKLKYQMDTKGVKLLYLEQRSSSNFTSDANLLKIINLCPLLESFALENVQCFNDAVALRILPSIAKNLTDIHLRNCSPQITGRTLKFFAAHCSKLTRFHFSYQCSAIKDAHLIAVVDANPMLQSFEETYHGERFKIPGMGERGVLGCILTDRLINALACNCPDLRVLTLDSLKRFTLPAVIGLFRACRHLMKVKIDTCDSIRFEIEEMEGGCAFRKSLDVVGFKTDDNNDRLLELFELEKDFHHVLFCSAHHLSDEVLIHLSDCSPHMTKLIVENCDDQFTSLGLKTIVECCKELRVLRIGDCAQHLSDEEYRSVFDIPNALTSITLQGNPNLTTEGVIHILSTNPQLTKFDFSNCKKADVKTVEKFLKKTGRQVDMKYASVCQKGCKCGCEIQMGIAAMMD
jgi:hypothetical protein